MIRPVIATKTLAVAAGRSTRVAAAVAPATTMTICSSSSYPPRLARSYATPSRPESVPESQQQSDGKKQGILSSLLRGSDTAKAEGNTTESHSRTVARGKFIHEIQRHDVRPECADEYKKVLAEFYPKLMEDDKYKTRLKGSWEVTVGDLETFYHIWEYDGYEGYDASEAALNSSSFRSDFNKALRPLIKHRSNWLCQEFAFWPTAEAKAQGGIYELRTYHLQPGKLLEWESHWRKGLEARRQFAEPVGAWFTQIGGLHTVFHIWHYPSLKERKETRDAAWQVATWSQTVSETVKLIDKMHAQIMRPMSFSPLR